MAGEQTRKWHPEAREISGFGGSYEEACRAMVERGAEWLEEHEDADPIVEQAEGVYGLTRAENDDADSLMSAMAEAARDVGGDGPTGAMKQACVNHAGYVERNGWDAYQEAMRDE